MQHNPSPDQFVSNTFSIESISIDTPQVHANNIVNKDMSIVRRLWSDEVEDAEDESPILQHSDADVIPHSVNKYLNDDLVMDKEITEVLSKSKKKKLKRRQQLQIQNNEGYRTRSKGGSSYAQC